jgi:hypothetical protein
MAVRTATIIIAKFVQIIHKYAKIAKLDFGSMENSAKNSAPHLVSPMLAPQPMFVNHVLMETVDIAQTSPRYVKSVISIFG